jgi:hypothetical protein
MKYATYMDHKVFVQATLNTTLNFVQHFPYCIWRVAPVLQWTCYNFFSLSTSILSVHIMKQRTLWTCNCYWVLSKRIVVKLMVCYLESLCSCFHFICVFLLNVLGCSRVLLSTCFMVYGKCCLKASWLMRVNS